MIRTQDLSDDHCQYFLYQTCRALKALHSADSTSSSALSFPLGTRMRLLCLRLYSTTPRTCHSLRKHLPLPSQALLLSHVSCPALSILAELTTSHSPRPQTLQSTPQRQLRSQSVRLWPRPLVPDRRARRRRPGVHDGIRRDEVVPCARGHAVVPHVQQGQSFSRCGGSRVSRWLVTVDGARPL